jgi:hypothetical protein
MSTSLALFLLGAASAADIRVGSPETPTLLAAQAALRAALSAAPRSNITVSLPRGFHRVPAGGLLLTAADSPAEGHAVTWRGEAGSVVSGGENVTGWSPYPAMPGVWAAPAPPGLATSTSRQLYVNGARAARTRVALAAAVPGGLALEQRSDCPACSYATSGSLQWSDPATVEFVYSGVAQSWSEARCAVESLAPGAPAAANCTQDPSLQSNCGYPYSTEAECANNKTADHPEGCCWVPGGEAPSGHWCVTPAFPGPGAAGTRITMQQPCFWNLVNRPFQPVGGAPPPFVENVREHLATSPPGTFYHDRAGQQLLYVPRAGEDLATAEVVVAVEESLLTLAGAARQSFEGVTFAFATWLRPGQGVGFVEQQAGACNACAYNASTARTWYCGGDDVYLTTPGNVALAGARDVQFVNSTFTHLGAYGASAAGGSQRVAFSGCRFDDLSAGAVMLGTTDSFNLSDVAAWDANFTVADCTIVNTGLEFTGTTAIFAAYVADTTIGAAASLCFIPSCAVA